MRHPLHSRTGVSRLAHPRAYARTGAQPGVCGSGVAPDVTQNCNPYGPSQVCREYYIGFDSEPLAAGGIAAAATLAITAEPQEAFVGLEVVVPSSIAPFFIIESLVVGRTPQAVAVGGVLAEVFSEVSYRAHLTLDPANRGTNITFTVTNVDTEPRRFTAAIFGQSTPCQ